MSHLIKLEISQQALGLLEKVDWTKPLNEHTRYAAIMLLNDARRRLDPELFTDVLGEIQVTLNNLYSLDVWGCGA